MLEVTVCLHHQLTAQVGNVVALGADVFSSRLKAVGGVDQLHLTGTISRLVLGQNPDIGADTGVHKHIGGQLNNAIQPIVFQNVLTDIGRTATGITGEQRGTVLDNGHLSVRCQLGKTIQHKQLLPIGNLRQPRRETAKITLRSFLFNCFLLPLPVDTEGWIADDVLEGITAELVIR